MALTDTEICTRALVRLGSGGIDSLTDGSDKAVACNAIYTSILENELGSFPWRFGMKKQQLNRLVDTPVNEWRYAYQLPTDRIGAPWAVFASNGIGASPIKQFEIFSDKLYTDHQLIYCDYPYKVTENMFPAYFTEFFVLALAAALAIPITDQANLASHYEEKAYGRPHENGLGGQLARARNADQAQQPPQMMESFELIEARHAQA